MSAFDDYLNAGQPQGQAQGFDSYLGDQQAPAQQAAPSAVPPVMRAPKAKSTEPGSVTSFGAGLGKGFGSTVLGVQQLLGHGLTALGSDTVGPWLTQDAEQGIKKLSGEYSPYSEAHPIAAGAGNIGGMMVGTAPTMMIGPGYAGLSLAGRVGLGAAQGAAGAAMMPVENASQPPTLRNLVTGETPQGNDYWAEKAKQVGLGGTMGAGLPLVTAGASAAGRGLWNAVKPVVQPTRFVGEGLAGAMDPAEAYLAASNIRSAPTFVPGSQPTTAQAAQTPFMVQTEKAAANIPAFKTAAAQRAIDNNGARWQALMGVAQDDVALKAAQKARSTAADPLYSAAGAQTANVGPGFMRLAQRPAFQQAMQQAETLAQNREEQLVWPQQGGSMAISGKALDYTNQALGDMIGSAKASGNKSLAAGLTDAQSRLQAWTQRYIPMQRQAAQTYAQMSVPVNTMEVGQQIANSLGTRAMNAGGVPEIPLMSYRSALTSAMNKGNAAKYGIDADALNTLQGIGQDLQRATVSNSIRSPGSDTAYNLAANGWLARNLYGPNFQGATGIGKTLAAGATAMSGHPLAALGVFGGGNKLGQIVGSRLQDRLTGLLMDPNAVLPYLDARAAAAAQAAPNPLMQGLLNYGRPALVNGFSGSLNKAN